MVIFSYLGSADSRLVAGIVAIFRVNHTHIKRHLAGIVGGDEHTRLVLALGQRQSAQYGGIACLGEYHQLLYEFLLLRCRRYIAHDFVLLRAVNTDILRCLVVGDLVIEGGKFRHLDEIAEAVFCSYGIGEHRSFNKGLGDSRARLRDITDEIEKIEIIIGKMETDHARYAGAVQRDGEGNPINALKLDNCQFTDEERMGKYLQALVKNTNTHNEYVRVGEIYGFPVCIVSEKAIVDGVEAIRNRFVVEGQYKYTFNNGNIAMSDTHAACMNFVNALEKLPDTIRQHRERAEKKRVDVPTLEAIVSRTWGKEDELKALKSDLAALDRKITAALAPKHDDITDGEEIKQSTPQQQPASITPPQSSKQPEDKSSLVAEPHYRYMKILKNRQYSYK